MAGWAGESIQVCLREFNIEHGIFGGEKIAETFYE